MFLILKDSIYYLIAIYGSSIFSFIYKIIIAKILGPGNYGFWSILVLILIYGNFLHLGLLYALVKEIPFYKGKEKLHDIEEIKNTVFSTVIGISILAGIMISISSIFFAKYGNNIFAILPLIALILILQQIKNLFLNYFIAEKNFKATSELIIYSTFLNGILAIILTAKFSLIGLPLGLVLGYPLVLMYILKKYKPIFKFQIHTKRLLSLIKIGFPIMILMLAYYFYLTVDRILIFKYLGRENIGYYSIAFGIMNFLTLLPFSLGIIIFPRLSEKFGAVGEVKNLKQFIFIPIILMAYVMSIVLGLIYLLLPTIVGILIPQYIPGINAGRIALMGIMFFSIIILVQKFLVVINRQIHSLFIVLLTLVLKIVLIYIFIYKHMGIDGVATAANLTYLFHSIFIVMYASYLWKDSFLESIKYLIKIFLPLLYLLLILLCFNYFKQHPLLNIDNKIILISTNCTILIIFVIMPFGYIIKRNLSAYFQKVSKAGV